MPHIYGTQLLFSKTIFVHLHFVLLGLHCV